MQWGAWLLARAQRLCRPVFWYLAFWTVALAVASMILGADSAVGFGRECVALLWFLGGWKPAAALVLLRVFNDNRFFNELFEWVVDAFTKVAATL